MKFGNQDSNNTALFILKPDNRPKITHLTGLGFNVGTEIRLEKIGDCFVFEGQITVEIEDTSSGFTSIIKKETKTEKKEIKLKDIQSLNITDESGRSIGKTALYGVAGAAIGAITLGPIVLLGGLLLGARKRYKSFLVIEVKNTDTIPYSIVLGGRKQKEMRQFYDFVINLANS